MNIKSLKPLIISLLLSGLWLSIATVAQASNVNWDKVKAEPITLFYPGQSSWEWLLTKHSAAKSVRKGAPCLECHEDEENEMGKTLVNGNKLESSPIKGKPGSIKAKVKTAHDKNNIYFQVTWKDLGFSSSEGKKGKYKTKITLMLGDKSVKEFPVAGCWGVCHDDATDMKSYKGSDKRHLYTSASRVKIKRSGGGDNFIDVDEMEELLEAKKILEYWQLRIAPDMTNTVSQGYILDKRHKLKKSFFNASATLKDGIWTAEFSRERNLNKAGIIPIKDEKTYTLGIAIHDDYVFGRKHYVSFGRSYSLGGSDSVLISTMQ